jgi:hypothetical protein
MSIEEAEAARQDRVSEARLRAEETKKRRREAARIVSVRQDKGPKKQRNTAGRRQPESEQL